MPNEQNKPISCAEQCAKNAFANIIVKIDDECTEIKKNNGKNPTASVNECAANNDK